MRSIIARYQSGLPWRPFYVTVIETPRGMLMREERFVQRIRSGEVSFDFIREIAESTLPFQNIANLLENVVGLTAWRAENVNLRSMCAQIIKACNKGANRSKPPATGFGEGAFDNAGCGVKRYPHTYECILHPHMVEVYKNSGACEGREAWERRVRHDGSPRIMERRVREAQPS